MKEFAFLFPDDVEEVWSQGFSAGFYLACMQYPKIAKDLEMIARLAFQHVKAAIQMFQEKNVGLLTNDTEQYYQVFSSGYSAGFWEVLSLSEKNEIELLRRRKWLLDGNNFTVRFELVKHGKTIYRKLQEGETNAG